MNLLLQRDDSQSFFRARKYILNVYLICTQEELELITDHQLYTQQMYAVPEYQEAKDDAEYAYQRSMRHSAFNPKNATKILADTAAAVYHTAKSQFSFVLTVQDAIDGFTIECPDLHQLVQCEQEIVDAFDQLSDNVDDALAFATGREQQLAPDGAEEDAGPPPADWANHQRWRYH